MSNTDIYDYLKQLRLNTDPYLKQKELAKELELSAPLISRIEHGTIKITDSVLSKYANFFDISLSTLRNIRDHNINQKDKIVKNTIIQNKFKIVNAPCFNSLSEYIKFKSDNIENINHIPILLSINDFSSPNNVIVIKMHGDSMNKIIPNQYLMVLDIDKEIENNDVIAYQFKDEDCNVRRLIQTPSYWILVPESYDSNYHPQTIDVNNLKSEKFCILGKVIRVQTDIPI